MKVNSMITAALVLVLSPLLQGCVKPAESLTTTMPIKPTETIQTPEKPSPATMEKENQETMSSGTGGGSGVAQAQSTRHYRDNPKRLYQLGELSVTKIKIGSHKFDSWVMDTDMKRAEGMMFLENKDFLDTDSMTFVYNEPFVMNFWMRNTLVDLDIAFVDKKFSIVRVTTMKKLDESQVSSNKSALYAIEFRAGLLKKKGITAGMRVEFSDDIKSQD